MYFPVTGFALFALLAHTSTIVSGLVVGSASCGGKCIPSGAPTEGITTSNGEPIRIQITGSGFLDDSSQMLLVWVGDEACRDPAALSDSSIQCLLPPGSGTSLPVTVLASGAAETTLTSDISYAVPSLEGLAGCTQGSTPASVVQCDRAGGEVVTLTGSNFGPSGAAVLIGDLACKSVAHDPTTPHNKLTCILPSGGGEALPVRILQRNTADASQNSSPLSLSYATCGLGVQPISYATYLSQSSLALGDCVPCQEGTFSDDFSHDRCTRCAAGRFSSYTSGFEEPIPQCEACPAGKFSGGGATECLTCPDGKYARSPGVEGEGASACADCPAGSYSALSDPLRPVSGCSLCLPGSKQPLPGQSMCSACLAGRFSHGRGALSCLECGPGHAQDTAGASNCYQCRAGRAPAQNAANLSVACEECQPGSYTTIDGESACHACQPGRFGAFSGLSACLDCQVGRFQSQSGQQKCNPCPAGNVSQASGMSSCSTCPGGFYSAFLSECFACSKGSYSEEGASSCSPCQAGRFAALPQQPACDLCPPGYETAGEGLSACSACQPGKTSDAQGRCQDCAEGRFAASPASPECQLCPTRTASSVVGAVGCQACTPGKHAPIAGLTSCQACEAGSFAPVGSLKLCVDCRPGTAVNYTGATTCGLCQPGSTTSLFGQAVCQDCPRGEVMPDEGATGCVACLSGLYANSTRQTACLRCGAGRYGGPVQCFDCQPGTKATQQGLKACQQCSPGYHVSVSAATSCFACEPGTFASQPGSAECLLCSKGLVSTLSGQALCNQCPVGRFAADEGSKACASCTKGRFSSEPGSAACGNCTAGSYNPFSGESSCLLCPRGSFSAVPGALACTQCLQGEFQTSEGDTRCLECEPGSYSDALGSSICKDCPVGSFFNAAGGKACLLCDKGTFAETKRSRECALCPVGSFNVYPGLSFCGKCLAGRAANASGSTACTDCLPGTYTADVGNAECGACPGGRAAAFSGATVCSQCRLGTFAQPGSARCDNCGVGSYGAQAGLEVCPLCPPGRFGPGLSATSCDLCPPGTFADTEGTSFLCSNCLPGKFAAAAETSVCTDCPPGSAIAAQQATVCNQCQPGEFAPAPGLDQCTSCAMGKFQEKSAATVCAECVPGRSAPTPGSVVCPQCELGSVAPEPGSQRCNSCELGVKSSEDFTVCLCDIGTYASSQNQSNTRSTIVCLECPQGAACNEQGLTQLTISTRQGWWRSTNSTTLFEKCLKLEHCEGGLGQGGCGPNRKGPLCSVCLPGYESATGLSPCRECPKQQTSIFLSAFVGIMVFAVLGFCYKLIYTMDKDLMKKVTEEQRKAREWDADDQNELRARPSNSTRDDKKGNTTGQKREVALETASTIKNDDASDTKALADLDEDELANKLRVRNKPNMAYKMKILITFLQICTTLTFALEIPWPSYYLDFIDLLSFVNLDFIPWQSVSCATKFRYYDKFLVIALLPILLTLLLGIGYLCVLRHHSEKYPDKQERNDALKRGRRTLWKFFSFTLFLLYPYVSSSVCRVFLCKTINGVSYLKADFTLKCYDDLWYEYLPVASFFCILYPIGIPVFFFWMIYKYQRRGRLKESGVQLQLGLIYAAYNLDCCFWEIVDMMHKLATTSLVPFIPVEWQLPLALMIIGLYHISLLVYAPYKRKADNRLHIFVQVELVQLVLAGHIIRENDIGFLDPETDLLFSILFISFTVLLMIVFAVMVAKNAKKMADIRKRTKQLRRGLWDSDSESDEESSSEAEETPEGEDAEGQEAKRLLEQMKSSGQFVNPLLLAKSEEKDEEENSDSDAASD